MIACVISVYLVCEILLAIVAHPLSIAKYIEMVVYVLTFLILKPSLVVLIHGKRT